MVVELRRTIVVLLAFVSFCLTSCNVGYVSDGQLAIDKEINRFENRFTLVDASASNKDYKPISFNDYHLLIQTSTLALSELGEIDKPSIREKVDFEVTHEISGIKLGIMDMYVDDVIKPSNQPLFRSSLYWIFSPYETYIETEDDLNAMYIEIKTDTEEAMGKVLFKFPNVIRQEPTKTLDSESLLYELPIGSMYYLDDRGRELVYEYVEEGDTYKKVYSELVESTKFMNFVDYDYSYGKDNKPVTRVLEKPEPIIKNLNPKESDE
ncbi:MAG TPA: hypothetical protein PKV16_09160 [Caldisericia bacterium]|nr:hypothetical protein [Caldisericia bacterium]HPF49896.1 hypothetical protein [Caldisericia bacterium]HPI84699.1 hypothetical protein [Caldisericia bacterium]HPQ93929.1 hypothetical protein [Caldisericia bacterium]HRV75729.1 hypothetical protein [Caldisericia bacterium]